MSKESRLCYHAVPRILQTDISWINRTMNETNDDECTELDVDVASSENCYKKRRLITVNDCDNNDAFQENLWDDVINHERWKPFSDYISDCRINVNVRQVLHHGQQSLN